MTRILLVEDQATLARALARALSRLRPDVEVLMATNGLEATLVLQEEDIDVVLTDLKMPVMDGFELLAWLMERKPATPVFVMTAYGTEEAVERLNSMGAVRCFTKPLSVHQLIDSVTDELAQSVRGHVENVSLSSFLQLMEMERKTCTLTVLEGEQTGLLYMRKGRLVDARVGDLTGEAAAMAIVGWQSATITISNYCATREQSIGSPIGYIVMEAMRVRDEAEEMRAHSVDVSSQWPPRESRMPRETEVPPSYGKNGAKVSTNGAALPGGTRALAVVETATGKVRSATVKEGVPLAELAQTAALVLRRQLSTLALFGQVESVEELVLSTTTQCDVIRPLGPAEFALLVFIPEETNLSMARLELERFMAQHPRAHG